MANDKVFDEGGCSCGFEATPAPQSQVCSIAVDALQACIASMGGDCATHHRIAANTADKAIKQLLSAPPQPQLSGVKSHVGHSLANGTWFVRIYPFETEDQAKAAQAVLSALAATAAEGSE